MISVTMLQVILSDWFKERVTVTLTLRSGAQFTGKVKHHPGSSAAKVLGDGITLTSRENGHEVHHDVDLAEVVAVTAAAA